MTRVERAHALQSAGSACSQAVLTVFAPDLGLDEKTAHRLATGLGAGFGRKQYTCGAISGSVLVLSLAYGGSESAALDKKEACYAKVRAFIEEMESRFGHSDCLSLLERTDLMTPEGKAAFKERSLGDSVCKPIVAACVERLEAILAQEKPGL